MSCTTRCLRSSLGDILSQKASRSTLKPKFVAGTRRYAHAQVALKQREPEFAHRRPSRESQSNVAGSAGYATNSELRSEDASQSHPSSSTSRTQNEVDTWVDETGWSPDPTQRRPTTRRQEEYFSRLFSELKFPPELTQKVLTHSSHSAARQGHNAALAFVGRRVMSAYFMMFLHSTDKLRPGDDIEDIAARSLNTHLLGEYVGNQWGVGRELVWAPPISAHLKGSGPLPGSSKVQGETVQAIMGMVFNQYGGAVAHRVFHTRLLPLVLVRGGLPQQFHEDVKRVLKRMGGSDGKLLVDNAKNSERITAAA